MKLFIRNPGIAILILIVSALTACKKENLAKGFTGTYQGTASHTEYQYPDMPDVHVYPECKIVISEVSRTKIQLTITPDPINPAVQIIVETDVTDATHFGHTEAAPRAFSRDYKGTLQSQELQYEVEEVRNSGPVYEFKFQGLRN